MRHIPEEELHAYLDQALSRSQCVEIECHLAACIRCRHERDSIASVRDRTTALLGLVSPTHQRRPSFAELALQARGRQASLVEGGTEEPPQRTAAWARHGRLAASLALAITAGWSARGLVAGPLGTPPNSIQQLVTGPELGRFGNGGPLLGSIFSAREPSRPVLEATEALPDPAWRPDPIERAAPRPAEPIVVPAVAPMALTVSTLDASEAPGDFPSSGVWRSVSWSEASALTGDAVQRIAGLPVVEIQVREAGPEERHLVMVAHLDPSGRIIRSIEGPVDRLGGMLAEVIERSDGAIFTSQPVRTAPDYVGGATGAPRRSIRVVALAGRIPADSLDQLTRRLTND